MKSSKIALAASLALALAFTLSCTDGGGDDPADNGGNPSGGGGNPSGSVSSSSGGSGNPSSSSRPQLENNGDMLGFPFRMENLTANTFVMAIDAHDCVDGQMEDATERENTRYEISGGKLRLWDSSGDEMVFSGTSSELKGEWIGIEGTDEISKAVFYDDSGVFFADMCMGEQFLGMNNGMYRYNVIDCNNVEMIIGGITIKYEIELGIMKADVKVIYKNKSCTAHDFYPLAEMEAACAESRETGEDYDDILDREYEECSDDLMSDVMIDIMMSGGSMNNLPPKLLAPKKLSKPAMLFRK